MRFVALMLTGATLVSSVQIRAENWVSVGSAPKAASSGVDASPDKPQKLFQTGSSGNGQVELVSELLGQVEQLQRQVSLLSGHLESQNHRIERLEKQSEARYLDIDRRLSSLTTSANSNSSDFEVRAIESDGSVKEGDQEAYQAAMRLLRNKDYQSAGTAFDEFIKQYPVSDLLQNALYWSGAVFSFQQDYSVALKRYKAVIDQFPQGLKAPDATYGYAITLHKTGDEAAARYWLNKVITDYPDSSGNAVSKAKEYLKRMEVD